MESLKLGPQPKANPVPTFTMSAAPTPSSSTTTTAAAHQDYSTVNLSDLHEFFPNIAQEAASGQVVAPPAGSSFALQESQFRVDATLVDEEIPEFPSFPDAQVHGTLDSLNMDDLVDLLNPRHMSEAGNGASGLPSCQQASVPKSTAAAQTGAASQSTSEAPSNPGLTYMNYPNSIANLLRSEDMMSLGAGLSINNSNHNQATVLDDLDELMSADEDRLMSIFNSTGQAGFVSGHPS